jgi:hypothetical protein
MRQHPVLDDESGDETDPPPVILISSAPPARLFGDGDRRPRPEPPKSRDPEGLGIPRRPEPEPPAPEPRRGVDPSRRRRLAGLAVVALGLSIAMLVWRPWAEPASEAASGEAGSLASIDEGGATDAADTAETPAVGLGPVTTEIRVLQPNYTVAPGDTVATIARRHGTTVEAIASLNRLENRNALRVGQRLILP